MLLNLWNPGCPANDFDEKTKNLHLSGSKNEAPGATRRVLLEQKP